MGTHFSVHDRAGTAEALHGSHELPPPAAAVSSALRPVPLDDRRSQNIPYLVGVDHVRAAAALLILYYHGTQLFSSQLRYGRMFTPSDWRVASNPLTALLAEGHTAVALFIVLSGFIFAFGAAGREVTYRDFLWNRFLRTYPLLIFLVMVGSAAHNGQVSFLPLLQTLLFGANLHGAQVLGNFSAMFWSVAVEWQLYLLFPALMTLLNRSGPGRLCLMVPLLWGARVLAYSSGMDPVHGLYSQLLGRLDQFLLGMVAGWAYARHRRQRAFAQLALPALAAALAGAYAFNHLGGWPLAAWWRLFTPTLEGLVWASFAAGYVAWLDRRERAARVPFRPLVAIGAASYSIYLWHFVIIQIQRSQGWVPRWLAQPELDALLVVTLTTAPLTLLFSAASYQLIERPFMALRKRYVQSREPLAAAG